MQLKEVQFTKETNTEFNYGRLWEVSSLLEIFNGLEKDEKKQTEKQKKSGDKKRTFK